MALSLTQFFTGPFNAKATAAVSAYRAVTLTTAATDFPTATHAGTSSVVAGFSTVAAAADAPVGIANTGVGMATVNAASVNIAAGDFLKVGTSAGILIKASTGETFCARALEPATVDGTEIKIQILVNGQSVVANSGSTISGASGSLTVADIDGKSYTLLSSNNGILALSIPGAASVAAGTRLIVRKTGTAGAVTITPAAGTIVGGATYAAIDAQNDHAEFIPVGTQWVILTSTIA
jgi:hypothetical protein